MDFTPSEKFLIFQDTNKYAAEYARYAISFAFYLNGAAATAIFAAGKTEFYPAATFLGLGAALAVICIGVAYVYTILAAETWRKDKTEKDGVTGFYFAIGGLDVFLSKRKIGSLYIVTIVLWIVSIMFFFKGIIAAWLQFK